MKEMNEKWYSAYFKVMHSSWRYVEWALISALIFILLIMIPVWSTPGNDFLFQLSILESQVLVIMIALSLANGFLIMMQLYIKKEVSRRKKLAHKAAQSATVFGIITSTLSATIACAACYSSVLAFLGLGTAAFLVEYRVYIALGALLITAAAIFYSGRRINHHCEVCTVDFDEIKKKNAR